MKRQLATILAAGLTRKPGKEEVFSRAFLPPRAERSSKLVITGK